MLGRSMRGQINKNDFNPQKHPKLGVAPGFSFFPSRVPFFAPVFSTQTNLGPKGTRGGRSNKPQRLLQGSRAFCRRSALPQEVIPPTPLLAICQHLWDAGNARSEHRLSASHRLGDDHRRHLAEEIGWGSNPHITNPNHPLTKANLPANELLIFPCSSFLQPPQKGCPQSVVSFWFHFEINQTVPSNKKQRRPHLIQRGQHNHVSHPVEPVHLCIATAKLHQRPGPSKQLPQQNIGVLQESRSSTIATACGHYWRLQGGNGNPVFRACPPPLVPAK